MPWQGIEGHDAVVDAFVKAEVKGRLAGSYLFIGPEGIGKSSFARKLAKAITCSQPRPGLLPCDACASCVQAEAGSHPDIDVVQKPDDRATIPLDAFIGDADHRMREGLCWRILLRPALGGRKVAIILDADLLSDEAANCLLKTLEEPPDGAVMILVGTALERQLPTIRSRCQIVRFRPLAADAVLRILAQETQAEPVGEARLQSIAAAADGSLARARMLLDPALGQFRSRLFSLLAERPLRGVDLARETLAIVEAAGKDAAPRRARLRLVFAQAIDYLRAVLRRHVAGDVPADPVVAQAVEAWAGDDEDASVALAHTLDSLDAIDRNANLTILVDAWTAILEEPRLAHPA